MSPEERLRRVVERWVEVRAHLGDARSSLDRVIGASPAIPRILMHLQAARSSLSAMAEDLTALAQVLRAAGPGA